MKTIIDNIQIAAVTSWLPLNNLEMTSLSSEYGEKEVEKVSIWTKSSKEGDEYVREDKRMHIWNMGKS